jgi:hypothetical protein
MTTTLKTLTSLALATAALTATTLATTGIASARNAATQQLLHSGALHQAHLNLGIGHGGIGPVLPPWLKPTGPNLGLGHGPVIPPGGFGQSGPPKITCGLPCEGKPIWGGHPPIYHGPDQGYGHDRWHWHFGYRNWRFPNFYSGGYAPGCSYEYKWRTIYVPGFGLERAIVKVCEAI